MKVIFVDGYNVINSWPNLKELREFEIARCKLIDIMENYATFNGYRVFLVFDAHKSTRKGSRREDISKYLSVVFTKEGELADTYIERAIDKIGKKIEVTVVTSDYLEQQLVFQRGACRASSLEFYNEVMYIEQKIKKKLMSDKNKRYLLMDNLDESIVEKLEKIRKGN